ncbi:MAG: hypothetical protein LUD72_04410 [Bacteroidales bacterium]|nr:hypothetical protein [Bacteroidales bacterium]
MDATIYIPLSGGDASKDFGYKGELTRDRYIRIMTDEYKEHKEGIDMMMPYAGSNISYNNFKKERINYKKMNYVFHECPCKIYDPDGNDYTLAELDEVYRKKDNLAIRLYLEPKTVHTDPDLSIDLKCYLTESLKVHNCAMLGMMDDEELLANLPKRDFKVTFAEDKSSAILQKCQILQRIEKSNVRFLLIVDRVIFID